MYIAAAYRRFLRRSANSQVDPSFRRLVDLIFYPSRSRGGEQRLSGFTLNLET